MAKSYKTSDFGRKAQKSRSVADKSSIVDGEAINRKTEPEKYRIAVALQDSNISTNGDDSLNKKAKLLLEEVCEVSMTYDENFSLIESCTETEDALISAEDKFPDSADQFYNLEGDQISRAAAQEYKEQEEAAETDVVSFAANLLGYSKDSNGQTTTNGQTTSNAVSTTTATVGTTATKTTTTSY